MKRILALPIALVALIASAGSVHAAPPTLVNESGTLPALYCGFEVSYTLTGKTKTITAGNVRTITSPGQKITLTNVSDPSKTVSYVITGVRREVDVTAMPLNIIETVVTGRNIVVNDRDSARPGVYVLVGKFNYAINAEFKEVRVFSGAGQVIDVCAALG